MGETNGATTEERTGRQDGGPMPLFYRRPEVLEGARHGALGLTSHDGYTFAAQTTAVPINAAEFPSAGVWFPIVFSGREPTAPLAVLGMRRDENLFVTADGSWQEGAYVPAYIRRYPFILTRPEADGDQVLLCLDMDSPRVAPDAPARLFEDGAPGAAAKHALEFCLEFQRQASTTDRIVKQLVEHDLLVDQQGRMELPDGEKLRLTDFKVIDRAKLDALEGEAVNTLKASGALAIAYWQVMSMSCWPRLAALVGERKKAA